MLLTNWFTKKSQINHSFVCDETRKSTIARFCCLRLCIPTVFFSTRYINIFLENSYLEFLEYFDKLRLYKYALAYTKSIILIFDDIVVLKTKL